ncbi:MAG: YceI family protein [Bacteroidetes bacterium]|nr:YceI family protein [Bacteroidota bacterium]
MKPDVKWSIDIAHSEVEFKVRHLMIAHVKGKFKNFDASIYTTGKDFSTAVIDFWIDVASLDTGDDKRDEHLKSADFFDAHKHKQITFVSSTIAQADADGNHELWGELSMMGITKNQLLNVQFGGITKDPWGNEKAGFTVTGKLNRNDWGLVWNTAMETGGVVVSDEVKITCEFELKNAGTMEETMVLESSPDAKNTF